MVEALSLHTPVNSSDDETSSSDGDNSPQGQAVRRVQEYQTSLSRREARANEYASLITDQKVIDTLNRTHLASKVKRAKTDIANNLKVKIYKLKQKRFVTEASGNMLNIIGSVEIYVQIPFVKSTNKLECLVLRGASVDREILVSCDTLMKWDLIHNTFGRETVTDYIHRNQVTR